MKKLALALITLLFFINTAYAASSVKSEQAIVKLVASSYQNGKANIGLHFKLEDGWHIYWRTAGDNGFPPMLDWRKSTNIAGQEIFWPAPNREIIEIGDGDSSESYSYKDEVLFPIDIMAEDENKPITLNLHINYAICKDICIPAEASLTLNIATNFNDKKSAELIESFNKLTPKPNGTYGINIVEVATDGKLLQISVKANESLEDSEIFIEGGANLAFNNPNAFYDENTATFNAPIKFLSDDKSLDDKNFIITFKNKEQAVEKTINGKDLVKIKAAKQFQDKQKSFLLIIL